MNGDLASAAQKLSLFPHDEHVVVEYALALSRGGDTAQAGQVLHNFLALAPRSAVAAWALGVVWETEGNAARAEVAYRRALQIAPDHAPARFALAVLLLNNWRTAEAESHLRTLLAQQPGHADALAIRGQTQQTQGQIATAVNWLRQSLALAPSTNNHSKLLAALQYDERSTPQTLLHEHRQWEAAYARPLYEQAFKPARPPGRPQRLRLGFLSADFGMHPVSSLLRAAVIHLDRSQSFVACYCDRPRSDADTHRFRAAADLWRETGSLDDAELARQIAADEIDILFDLGGHAGRRLLVFARRPAPRQATWLGYVGTTGLSAMDWLLADRFHVPAGEESAYAEQVLRLPNSYACYQAPSDAPEVAALPALTSGQFTFGSFNNPSKLSPPTLDAWAAILRRVPNARLLLKYGWMGEPAVQYAWRQRFEARGVGGERILIEGSAPRREMLENYCRIDLALDPQPYSGGVTTCEALWMGVPVVTFPGRTFCGRHSTSYLTTAGLAQFVAADWESYIALAANWAARVPELATLRQTLRSQVQGSPLCDGPAFARNLLALLQASF